MRAETKAEIEKCLNCKYTYCINCLENGDQEEPKPFDWNRPKITKSQRVLLDYYWMGYTDQEIAEKIGITNMAVITRRTGLGLPALPKYLGREGRKKYAREIMGGRFS